MEIEVRPEAVQDGARAYNWLLENGANTERFVARIALAIERLLEFPRSGTPMPGGRRKGSLAPFKFALIYRVAETKIVVIAIVHLRSDNRLLRP